MSALGIFCLLLGILALNVAETEAVTCSACLATSSTEPCQATCTNVGEGGCLTFSTNNTLDGNQEISYYRGCLSLDIETYPSIFHFGKDKYYVSNLTLCTTENCNKDAYPVAQNFTPNGLSCKACFSVGQSTCDGENIPCLGLELYCANASGIRKKRDAPEFSKFAAHGCTTLNPKMTKGPYQMNTKANIYTVNAMELTLAEVQVIPTKPPPQTTKPSPKTTNPPPKTTNPPPKTTPRSSSPSKHPRESLFFSLLLPGLSWALLSW